MADSPDKSIQDLLGGGGISQLLQNPEIAAKLPRIMEALAPVMAEMKAEKAAGVAAAPTAAPASAASAEAAQTQAAPAEPAAAEPAPAPAVLPAAAGAKPTSASRRMALLRALSPYLSEERQSALDTVMKVSTLLDLLSEVM